MKKTSRYTTDTSKDADAVQLELIRAMAPAGRARRALRLTSRMLKHAKDAIRRRHSEYSEEQVGLKFIELHYGEELASEVRRHLENRQQ